MQNYTAPLAIFVLGLLAVNGELKVANVPECAHELQLGTCTESKSKACVATFNKDAASWETAVHIVLGLTIPALILDSTLRRKIMTNSLEAVDAAKRQALSSLKPYLHLLMMLGIIKAVAGLILLEVIPDWKEIEECRGCSGCLEVAAAPGADIYPYVALTIGILWFMDGFRLLRVVHRLTRRVAAIDEDNDGNSLLLQNDAFDDSLLDQTAATEPTRTEAPSLDTTVLIAAVKSGDVDMINTLLNTAGPGLVNQKDRTGWTALHFAAAHDFTGIVEQLLEADADPSIRTPKGNTALKIATKKKSLNTVALFRARHQVGGTGPPPYSL